MEERWRGMKCRVCFFVENTKLIFLLRVFKSDAVGSVTCAAALNRKVRLGRYTAAMYAPWASCDMNSDFVKAFTSRSSKFSNWKSWLSWYAFPHFSIVAPLKSRERFSSMILRYLHLNQDDWAFLFCVKFELQIVRISFVYRQVILRRDEDETVLEKHFEYIEGRSRV